MNRRGFIGSLGALVGAASLSPNIFIPKFEPVVWKAPRWKSIAVPNPEWANAPYEIHWIGFTDKNGMLRDGVYQRAWHHTHELIPEPHMVEPLPMRFYDLSDNTNVVHPYVLKQVRC